MAKATPAFQFYPADFLTAVAEWEPEEVGIYIKMLCFQWTNGSLPSNFKKLARTLGVTVKELEDVWPVVGEKFTENDGRLQNNRLEEVRKEQEEYRAKKREAGRKSGEARRNKKGTRVQAGDKTPVQTREGTEGGTEPRTKGEQKANPSSSSSSLSLPSSSPPPSETSPKGDVKESAKPTQPQCPHQKIIDLYHATLPELPQIRDWNESCKSHLRRRWREKPERQNIEWWERYFKTVRCSSFLMGNVRDFQANLLWLIKPENFSKVLNGFYADRGKQTGTVLTPAGEKTAASAQEWLQGGNA